MNFRILSKLNWNIVLVIMIFNYGSYIYAKGPELKNVTYKCKEKGYKYKVEGYVADKNFVNDSQIKFFSDNGKLICEGTYETSADYYPKIDGILYFQNVNGNTAKLKGEFLIKTGDLPSDINIKNKNWSYLIFDPVPENTDLEFTIKESITISITQKDNKLTIQNPTSAINYIEAKLPPHAYNLIYMGKFQPMDLSSLNGQVISFNDETISKLSDVKIKYKNGLTLSCQNCILNIGTPFTNKTIKYQISGEGISELIWPSGDKVEFNLSTPTNISGINNKVSYIIKNLITNGNSRWITNYNKIIEGNDWFLQSYVQGEGWINKTEEARNTPGSWVKVFAALDRVREEYKEEEKKRQEEQKKRQEEEKIKQEKIKNYESQVNSYKVYISKTYPSYRNYILNGQIEIGMNKEAVSYSLFFRIYNYLNDFQDIGKLLNSENRIPIENFTFDKYNLNTLYTLAYKTHSSETYMINGNGRFMELPYRSLEFVDGKLYSFSK